MTEFGQLQTFGLANQLAQKRPSTNDNCRSMFSARYADEENGLSTASGVRGLAFTPCCWTLIALITKIAM